MTTTRFPHATPRPGPTASSRRRRGAARERGAAAILSMMYLVIFSSLAAAMAIVAQGNLSTADAHLKVSRALAGAETGMHFIIYRLNEVTANVQTTDGLIDGDNAGDLWTDTRDALAISLSDELHSLAEPVVDGTVLTIGPIALGAGDPFFTATLQPHPLPGEDYDAPGYDDAPFDDLDVSAANPLGGTWIRVRVEAIDGANGQGISRAIEMDFRMDKRIRFALLSKSRIMIGRNVMIEGPVGSRFVDTHLPNGHPVQMVSDFRGLDGQLDVALDALIGSLVESDADGDNRLDLADPSEVGDLVDPEDLDVNGDGYIDDYDMFLDHFDSDGDGAVDGDELNVGSHIEAAQLLTLIDYFGDPTRDGYGDGVIDADDRYAKIRGQVMLTAAQEPWQTGAADPAGDGSGAYQDFFQGTIHPDHGESPLTFEANDASVHHFEPEDFDVSSFRDMTDAGSFATQTSEQLAMHDPNDPDSPQPVGAATEETPYGAAHPYDFYDRPVYENMTFRNVRIPRGTNALFRNCRFIGVTFVETTTTNNDPNFNLAGAQEADGSLMFPDAQAQVEGTLVADTKDAANNLRFDGCDFEGSVISDAPTEFTHARNKLAFTGETRFIIEDSTELSDDEKSLFRRSTLLTPHYSVEMGTFVGAADPDESVQLSGTIVAGVIDLRGQIDVNGTVLTTFEPTNQEGPVIGDTSPQFNTTLGYFPSSEGDLEAELPASGMGAIRLRYDPTLAMPDGILGPIEIRPVAATYRETGGAY